MAAGQLTDGAGTAEAAEPTTPASRQHIRIMVLDDEPTVLKSVQYILESQNYSIRTFSQPDKAMAAAEREAFHICLVDIRMPEINGFDFVRKLRERGITSAAILMTAYPSIESAAEAMRSGGHDYITKPFTHDQLVQAVERVCQKEGLIFTTEEDLNRLIGQRIRTHRLEQRLTLRELSEKTKLTTSQLSQVELGKNAASVWSLARIASALKLSLSDLLSGL